MHDEVLGSLSRLQQLNDITLVDILQVCWQKYMKSRQNYYAQNGHVMSANAQRYSCDTPPYSDLFKSERNKTVKMNLTNPK